MGDYTPQSRTEEILYDMIHSLEYTERPQSRIEELLLELKAVIEAGSGTTDYDDLENKPSINNVELSGDKSLADLGAASEEAVAAKASQSDIAPAFLGTTAYTVGDVVYYDGSLYRFTADHAAGAWDSADVESVTVDDLVDGLKPVDSVTDGDMRAVTSNSVYDALALKADSPVDAVTNGESKAVTSNAVYDYLNDSVSVTRDASETISAALNRLFALIDMDKVTQRTVLLAGSSQYRLTSKSSTSLIFVSTPIDFSSDNVHLYANKIAVLSSGSYYKQLDISTGSGSGSGTDLRWSIGDYSSSTSLATSFTLIY